MLRKTLICILTTALLLASLAACGPTTGDEVTVFAASSLTNAMEEMGAAYEAAHPGLTVLFNFGGSSTLATQLIEGAPADVFASANQAQMQAVQDAGLIAGGPVFFASNRLTIIVPADNPANIHSPADLAQPGLSLVLAAPGVPARQYSDQALATLGDTEWQAAVYANLVSEEQNVRLVVAKVALGEADAGIVYRSDVTPTVAGDLLQIAIPEASTVAAAYPVAALAGAPHSVQARDFVEFLFSPEGQAILQSWGFGAAP